MGETVAGYKYLLTYQYSSVIYDFTVEFCRKFLPGRELLRQRDQMTQAARSGKQNIVEGYELQSLDLAIWPKDDPRMRGLRELRVVREPVPHIPQIPHIPREPELAANLLVMLCQRTTYLLEKQIDSLREKFIKEGGFRENLFRKRLEHRRKH